MFPALRFTEEEVADYLENASSAMVRGSLARARHDWFNLLNLISTAARPHLAEMRGVAQLARRRHYGKTVSVYAPLYIGNTCVNSCRYCDFRRQRTGTVRRNLTLDEIRAEANAIRETGIDSLLVVAGEDPRVDDDDLEQMMLAFRIVFPQCCMTVSTREKPAFRDRIVQTAADNMSAGSRVTPGGYAVAAREHPADVAQFTLSDGRSPAEVFATIRANGQEVVFKNWDNRI